MDVVQSYKDFAPGQGHLKSLSLLWRGSSGGLGPVVSL